MTQTPTPLRSIAGVLLLAGCAGSTTMPRLSAQQPAAPTTPSTMSTTSTTSTPASPQAPGAPLPAMPPGLTVSTPSQAITVTVPADPTCADLTRMQVELMNARRRLDDWPALARFREANAELPSAAAGQARVVFLGDSITDSWDEPRYGGFFPGKGYINRGISGQTTPQMLLRLRADVLAHKPKAIVLLAGTNDIAGNTGPMTIEQIQDNVATIAELATLHHIEVVLASILPTSNYHFKGDDPRLAQTYRRPLVKIRAINDWMKGYAKANGHVYLDYYGAMVDAQGMLKTELSEDDLHPNAAGYAIMKPLAEAAITQALK